jgi:hypothetical protein
MVIFRTSLRVSKLYFKLDYNRLLSILPNPYFISTRVHISFATSEIEVASLNNERQRLYVGVTSLLRHSDIVMTCTCVRGCSVKPCHVFRPDSHVSAFSPHVISVCRFPGFRCLQLRAYLSTTGDKTRLWADRLPWFFKLPSHVSDCLWNS